MNKQEQENVSTEASITLSASAYEYTRMLAGFIRASSTCSTDLLAELRASRALENDKEGGIEYLVSVLFAVSDTLEGVYETLEEVIHGGKHCSDELCVMAFEGKGGAAQEMEKVMRRDSIKGIIYGANASPEFQERVGLRKHND